MIVSRIDTQERRSSDRGSFAAAKPVFFGAVRKFYKGDIPTVAAGVTYSMLLAFFPAVTAFVSLYGLFADVETARQHLRFLRGFLPREILTFIGNDMMRVTTTHSTELGAAFVISLAISLWSANWGASALIRSLDVAYGCKESRGIVQHYLVSLAITVGALLVCIAGIVLLIALPLVQKSLGLAAAPTWFRWPFLFIGDVLGITALYAFGPDRSERGRHVLVIGATVANSLWLIGSILFSWYAADVADYATLYGPFSTIIGFMVWIWLGVMMILFGALLNGEIESRTRRRPPC